MFVRKLVALITGEQHTGWWGEETRTIADCLTKCPPKK